MEADESQFEDLPSRPAESSFGGLAALSLRGPGSLRPKRRAAQRRKQPRGRTLRAFVKEGEKERSTGTEKEGRDQRP